MNDFYQGEEVLPAFELTIKSLHQALVQLVDNIKADISKNRAAIEQLEKDPRKDGLQSADLKHAKNLSDLLHRDLFDAEIWAGSFSEENSKEFVTLRPHQARWLFRYQAAPSIRYRLRK